MPHTRLASMTALNLLRKDFLNLKQYFVTKWSQISQVTVNTSPLVEDALFLKISKKMTHINVQLVLYLDCSLVMSLILYTFPEEKL